MNHEPGSGCGSNEGGRAYGHLKFPVLQKGWIVRSGKKTSPKCLLDFLARCPRSDRRRLRRIGSLRSEEHTSELQSLMRISYAVFCLKKKQGNIYNKQQH